MRIRKYSTVNEKMLLHAAFLLLGIFISALSQIMLKKATLKKFDSIFKEYLNPLVISSYGLYIVTTVLSVVAYKEIPLSLGMVLETTGYFYVTVLGVVILGEKLNMKKMFSLLVIIAGIIIYALS